MSVVFTAIAVAVLVVSILINVARVVLELILLPINILTEFVLVLLSILPFGLYIIENRRAALIFTVVAVIVAGMGYVGLYQTNVVINVIDVVFECILSPLYEIIYKFVINSIIGLWKYLIAAYNTVMTYVISRLGLWLTDTADVVECMLQSGNILRLLELPKILWTLLYSLLFSLNSEPRISRHFVFDQPRHFYFESSSPLPPDLVAAPSNNYFPNALEFPEDFGAFGPPEDVVPTNIISVTKKILRELYIDLAVLVGKIGDLLTRIAADLQKPAGRFASNLILKANAPESYWGEAADVISQGLTILTGTFLYPSVDATPAVLATGYSRYKYFVDAIITKSLRVVASFLRVVWLYINDATTIFRADLVNPATCEAFDLNAIADLFKGFPVVDLFVSVATLGQYGSNLNIFRSNWEFCRQYAITYHKTFEATILSSTVTNFVQLAAGIIPWRTHSTECGIITANSLADKLYPPPNSLSSNYQDYTIYYAEFINNDYLPLWDDICFRWDGQTQIQYFNRIDYLGELFDVFRELALLFIDPFDEPSHAQDRQDLETNFHVAECFIDRTINAIIFATDVATSLAIGNTDCRSEPFMFFWHFTLESCIIKVLNEVAYPDLPTCAQLVPPNPISQDPLELQPYLAGTKQNNPFFCGLAKLSYANGGFFKFLCDAISFKFELFGADLFGPIQNLQCSQRKRSLDTLESALHDARIAASPTYQTLAIVQLHAMKIASEIRVHFPELEKCLVSDDSPLASCSSKCSIGPCVGAVFNCIEQKLTGNETSLHHLLVENRAMTERVVNLFAMAADFIYGCEDSSVLGYFDWSHALKVTMRDFLVRFYAYAFEYSSAYSQCMLRVEEMRLAGEHPATIELEYLRCIGAPVPESPSVPANETGIVPVEDYFRQSLKMAGIDGESTFCGSVLTQYGLLADQKPYKSASNTPFEGTYKFCGFMHAFGSRATHSGYAQRPLEDFLDFYRMPLALTSATANLDVEKVARLRGMDPMPELPQFVRPQYLLGRESTPRHHFHQLIKSINASITGYSSILAFGTYLADMQDMMVNDGPRVSVEELDHREKQMRQHAFETVSGVMMNPGAARQRFTQEVKHRHSNSTAPLSATMIFNALARSISWTARTDHGVVYKASASYDWDGRVRHLVVRMDLHADGSPPGGYAFSPSTSITWKAFEAVVRGTVVAHGTDASLVQSAAVALQQLGESENRLALASTSKMLKLANAIRSVTSTVFRIVNRRLRIQAFPPVQAAVMALDVLSNSDVDSLERWSRNELGYVVGVGFVPIEQYTEYMTQEQLERERWLAAYSPYLTAEEINAAPLLSRKWADRELAQRAHERKYALPRPKISLWKRWYKPNTRRHGFSRLAQFLLKHNLGHSDEHLHRHVPKNWQFYPAAVLANSTQERTRIIALAAATSDDVVLQALQSVFDTLGIAVSLDDLVASFQQFGEELWEKLSDTFDQFQDTVSNILLIWACPGTGAYRDSGTGTYKPGCLPFLPERLLDFWSSFPQPPALLSGDAAFWGWPEGPGYLRWPVSMIEVDCPYDRQPQTVCPIPPPYLWSGFTENGPGNRPNLDLTELAQAVCITDFCPAIANPKADNGFPLCVIGCDYCERTYHQASEFFSNGFEVLLVWIQVIRAYFRLIFSTSIWFVWVLIMFPLFALSDFVPFLGTGIITFIVVFVPLFYLWFWQDPVPLVFTLFPMYIFHEIFPLLGWFVWLFALFPTVATVFSGVAFDTAPVLNVFEYIFPDRIVLIVLNAIRTSSFLGSLFNLTTLDATIMILENNIAGSPDVAIVLYSLFAFILVPVLLIIGLSGIVVLFYGLRILRPIASFFAVTLVQILAIYVLIRNFGLFRRVSSLEEEVESREDENMRTQQQLDSTEQVQEEVDSLQDQKIRKIQTQLAGFKEE